MQKIFLSDALTAGLCFLVWLIIQLGVANICLHLPDRLFNTDSPFFKAHRFEQDGQLYERIFHVRSWKHLLPDGGALWKKRGYKKRKLENMSEENLTRFWIEASRGELVHWLCIALFWVFGFFAPPVALWGMLLYALLANLPCIFTQRYNRPRVLRLLKRKKALDSKRAFVV